MSRLPLIADLSSLGLSQAALEGRAKTIGGSDANILAAGNPERIYQMWAEKAGKVEREDLSQVLPVQMGNWTEPFNAAWYQQETGNLISERDSAISDMEHSWRTATLDGFVTLDQGRAIWEAKHTNAFASMEEAIDKYFPQLQHNMDVAGVNFAVLSVLFGNLKYGFAVIERDEDYAAQLFELEKSFYQNMVTGEAPVVLNTIEKPVDPDDMRVVDMEGNNEWASLSADYFEHKEGAATFDKAKASLKKLVEKDVKMASGYGLIIKRSANGSLRFSEE